MKRFRFRFRRGDAIFEVDAVVATASAWRETPESGDTAWLAARPFRFVLALRLTLPPEVGRLIDDGSARARYESDIESALSGL